MATQRRTSARSWARTRFGYFRGLSLRLKRRQGRSLPPNKALQLTRHGVTRSFRDFVVLGAGFDSRAYRLQSLQNTTVFEVDHPATQAVKRRSLEHALRVLPKHVRFVATDFTQHDL